MFKSSTNFNKEEIFRMYEQSELSEIFNEDREKHKNVKKSGKVSIKFPFFYTILSVGAVAGAVSFITLFKRYKLF